MLFGSALSSYQAEGDNINSDWWLFDNGKSGKASFFWEKWREDFKLLKELGQNAFRFSIEWSRIFKSENEIDYKNLETYKKMVYELKNLGIEVILTVWHFSNPIWFYKKGGFLLKDNIRYFLDFVEIVSKHFEDVNYFIILNEPNVWTFKSYLEGSWIPQEKNLIKAFKVLNNLVISFKSAYEILKNTKRLIGLAQNIIIFKPYSYLNPISVISKFIDDKFFNFYFLDKVKKYLDFIGINYYTRVFVKFFSNYTYRNSASKNCLGWEIYPQGIYQVIKKIYKRYRKPIMITENGICTNNDYQRISFIKEHLEYVKKAMSESIPIIGYIYWSFLDNYEWTEGFEPRFGLVEVDYLTGNRKVRNSAYFYKEMIEQFFKTKI